jgi:Reverse transcriptase (RNA-dependent DNA polymerase)
MKSHVICEDERLNLYHFAKQKNEKNNIKVLQIGDTTTGNISEIKRHIEEYYQQLLGANEQVSATQNSLNLITARVDSEFSGNLIRPIELDEIEKTLKFCTKKKSPGPDGLTYEFYQKNFETVGTDLQKLYNCILMNPESTPKNFAKGIIVLIPKKKNGKTMSDFRPISLLNCDYKLFTKILANRICEKLETIIGDGQAACVKNRTCVRNVTRLRNFIIKTSSGTNRARSRNKFGLFSLDLNKAFDQVNHDFLWKCLERFGFPGQIIAVLKNLYKNATSRVLVNGFLSNDIKIRRSVRQGCPLSMVLFVLYIEPLLKSIDLEIEGLELDAVELKSLAYADDVYFIVRGDEEADRVFDKIQEFCRESGATLSYKKSKFLRINECQLGPQKIAEEKSLTILGIVFSAKINDAINANFEAQQK